MTMPAFTSSGSNNTTLGVLRGMGAGALWGVVFLAPELVRDFTPLQLAIGRYRAYELISAALAQTEWITGLRARIAKLDLEIAAAS